MKKNNTRVELANSIAKARELQDKAYTMALTAIKKALNAHNGRINIFSADDIINDIIDSDDLIPIERYGDHNEFYWLYAITIDEEGRIEFLVVDPTNRNTVKLQNQGLDYDIMTIGDAMECTLVYEGEC